MSARAIASATIQFGELSIPVKLYSTGDSSKEIELHRLHKGCGARVKQQNVCVQHDSPQVLGRDEIVKGFEIGRWQHVAFSDEELKAFEPTATHVIEISEYAPSWSIDPIHFDRSTYLGPESGWERAYGTLVQALVLAQKWAIGRYAARGKNALVVVRPILAIGLVLHQLRQASEIRPFADVPLTHPETEPNEVALAVRVIKRARAAAIDESHMLTSRVHNRDEVTEAIQKAIAAKRDAGDVQLEPQEGAGVVGLTEGLKASAKRPKAAAPRRRAGKSVA